MPTNKCDEQHSEDNLQIKVHIVSSVNIRTDNDRLSTFAVRCETMQAPYRTCMEVLDANKRNVQLNVALLLLTFEISYENKFLLSNDSLCHSYADPNWNCLQ